MGEYKFGAKGQQRKDLVNAISEILNQPKKYLGAPSYGFTVGSITINKEGTATGIMSFKLLESLAERGFVPEADVEAETNKPETDTEEITAEPEMDTPEILEETAEPEEVSAEPAPETSIAENIITVPLQGFMPESLDNLGKMVLSKETLIKKALGAESLPIRIIDDKLIFDWFKSTDIQNKGAYTQFIESLCETAKEKKRITAKAQESYENEKFAMRVWLIGLGLIGREYSQIRKLMGENLGGNSAFRYGKPEVADKDTASAPETATEEAVIAAGEASDESPADTQPETEGANVGGINADIADDGEAYTEQ